MFRIELTVRPKDGVKDPQAEAVEESLGGIGYQDVHVLHVGRRLSLTVACGTEDRARELAEDMCEKILVNPNLETYELEVTPAEAGRAP